MQFKFTPVFKALILSLGFSASSTFGAPTGGEVEAGDASISASGNTTTITQTTNKAIINWQTYDVAKNENVNYVDPNASAVTLNRITSGSASDIEGHINSNGQVWIINPNGVVFGKNSEVNVAGLVASTMDIQNKDFMNGTDKFTQTANNAAKILNQGNINADGGYVALLAPQIENTGVVEANLGTVAMGAGTEATLTFSGNELLNIAVPTGAANALISSSGMIEADGGHVLLNAQGLDDVLDEAINITGIIKADTVADSVGGLVLTSSAQTILNNATISAQGGSVEVLGKDVGLFGTTSIDTGSTGNIHVGWDKNDANAVEAQDTIVQSGVSLTGNFVETSGDSLQEESSNIHAATWLLDPYDLTIEDNSGSNENVDASGTPTNEFDAAGDPSILDTSILDTALESSDITVTTGSGGTDNGDITVTDVIDPTSGTGSLTLDAAGGVNINAGITLGGGLTISAGDIDLNTGGSISADGVTLASDNGGIVENGGSITDTGSTELIANTSTGINLADTSNSFSNVTFDSYSPGGTVMIDSIGGFTATGYASGANITLVSNATGVNTGTLVIGGGGISSPGANIHLTDGNTAGSGYNGINLTDDVSTGTVTMSSRGSITQTSGAITATNTSVASGGATTLTQTTGDYGTISSTGVDGLSVTNSGAGVALGAIDDSGSLTVNADGNIGQTGVITMTAGSNTANFNIVSGGSGTIILDENNKFAEDTVNVGGVGTVGTVNIIDVNATQFTVGNISAADASDVTLTGVGTVALNGNITGNQIFVSSSAAGVTQSSDSTLTAHYNVSDDSTYGVTLVGTGDGDPGPIVQAGTIDTYGSDVLLDALHGGITQNGTGVIDTTTDSTGTPGIVKVYTNDDDVTLDGANLLGTLISAGGLGSVTVNDVGTGGLILGALATNGNFDISAKNSLTQAGALTMNPSGTVSFSVSGTGTLTLINSSNDFANNAVTLSGGAVQLTDDDATGLLIGTITGTTVALTEDSTGSIADGGSGSITATTSTDLTAMTGTIDLENTANAFGTTLTADADGITLAGNVGSGGFELGGGGNTHLTDTGALSLITTGGNITQSGAVTFTAGTTNFNAGSDDITLNNTSNDFGGNAVSLTGSTISLDDNYSGGLVLGGIIASGNLAIDAKGGITQSGSASEDAINLTSGSGGQTVNFNIDNSGTGVVDLNNTNNDFNSDVVNVSATSGSTLGNVTIDDADSNRLLLGNIIGNGSAATGGTLTVAASHNIEQSGSTRLNVGGVSNFDIINDGEGEINLNSNTNDFNQHTVNVGQDTSGNVDAVTIDDDDSTGLVLGNISAMGTSDSNGITADARQGSVTLTGGDTISNNYGGIELDATGDITLASGSTLSTSSGDNSSSNIDLYSGGNVTFNTGSTVNLGSNRDNNGSELYIDTYSNNDNIFTNHGTIEGADYNSWVVYETDEVAGVGFSFNNLGTIGDGTHIMGTEIYAPHEDNSESNVTINLGTLNTSGNAFDLAIDIPNMTTTVASLETSDILSSTANIQDLYIMSTATSNTDITNAITPTSNTYYLSSLEGLYLENTSDTGFDISGGDYSQLTDGLALIADNGGNITQSAVITNAPGELSLNAVGGGNINLSTYNNYLGKVSLNNNGSNFNDQSPTGNVTLKEADGGTLTLSQNNSDDSFGGSSYVGGILTITSAGNSTLTQNESLEVVGTTSINMGTTGEIDLDDGGNNFGGSLVTLTGGDITLADDNSNTGLDLGPVTATGDINITDWFGLTVNNTVETSKADGAINLTANNDNYANSTLTLNANVEGTNTVNVGLSGHAITQTSGIINTYDGSLILNNNSYDGDTVGSISLTGNNQLYSLSGGTSLGPDYGLSGYVSVIDGGSSLSVGSMSFNNSGVLLIYGQGNNEVLTQTYGTTINSNNEAVLVALETTADVDQYGTINTGGANAILFSGNGNNITQDAGGGDIGSINAGSGIVEVKNGRGTAWMVDLDGNNSFQGLAVENDSDSRGINATALTVNDAHSLTLGQFHSGLIAPGDTFSSLNVNTSAGNGNVSQFTTSSGYDTLEALSVTGTTTITAGSGTIILTNSDNDFGHSSVNLTGSAIQLTDNDTTGLVIGTISGSSVDLIENTGSITDGGTGHIAATTTDLTANNSTNGYIDLTGTSNSFGTVTASALGTDGSSHGITLEDYTSGGLTIASLDTHDEGDGSDGNITVNAHDGSLILNSGVTAGTGTVNLTADGSITDNTGAGYVSAGTTNLTATSDIDLENIGSNIFGTLAASGNGITLAAQAGFDIGSDTGLTNTGNLSLITNGGAITQTAALHVTGTTTLDAGASGTITLNNTNNNFDDQIVTLRGGAIDIVDANTTGLMLGNINASGNLTLKTAGAIAQSGSDTITMSDTSATTANFTAGNGRNVNLSNNNSFGDNVVSVVGAGSTAAGTVSINDTKNLTVGAIDSGALTLETTGTIVQSNGTSIDATGTALESNETATLSQTGHSYGTISTTGSNVGGLLSVTDTTGVTLGAITSHGLSATGSSITTNNDITESEYNVTLNSTVSNLALGNSISANDVILVSAGAISQSAGTIIATSGTVLSSAGLTNLGDAGNNLGTVSTGTSVGGLTLHGDGVTLGVIDSTGAVDIAESGDIALTDDLTATSQSVTLGTTDGVINQTGGTITAGNTVLSSAGLTTLNQTGNSLGTVSTGTSVGGLTLEGTGVTLGAITSTNDVSVTESGAISLTGALNAADQDVTLHASAGISDGDSDVGSISAATTELTADSGSINLVNDTTNSFGTIIASTNGTGNITLVDDSTNGLTINTLNTVAPPPLGVGIPAADITVTSAGTMLITGGITTTGAVSLTADSGAITDNGGNGYIQAGTTNLTADDGAIDLENNTQNQFGILTATTTGTGHGITVVDDNTSGLVLGNISDAGDLTVTAATGISETGAITMTGTGAVNFDVTNNSGSVILDKNNNFNQNAVSMGDGDSVGDVTINDMNTSGLVLGDIMTEGNLSVTGSGPITQTGIIDMSSGTAQANTASFDVVNDSGTVNLSGNNDFNQNAVSIGDDDSQYPDGVGNITLNDVDGMGLVLGNIITAGNLSVTADGNITQTGAITMTNTDNNINFDIASVDAGSINLDNTSNDFNGNAVNVGQESSGTVGDVTINDMNTSGLVLGNISDAGDLTVTAATGISETGAITMTGTGAVNFDVTNDSGSVILDKNNNFNQNAVNVGADDGVGDITIYDQNNPLVLGTVTSNNGNIIATANNSSVTLTQAINAGTGTVTVTAGNSSITDSNQAGYIVAGSTILNADGSIDLESISNQFGSVAADSGGVVTLTDGNVNGLAINHISDYGNIIVNSAGALTLNGLVSGTIGTVSLTSSGDITDNSGAGSISASATTLNAGTHSITLTNANNNFGTSVTVGHSGEVANAVSLSAGSNGIAIDQVATSLGSLSLTTAGNITQVSDNLDVTGTTTLNAGVINLNNGDNILDGAITATNQGNVTIDANSLINFTQSLGSSGNYELNLATTSGNITDISTVGFGGGSTLTGMGNISVSNPEGAITINDYGIQIGTVSITNTGTSGNHNQINFSETGGGSFGSLNLNSTYGDLDNSTGVNVIGNTTFAMGSGNLVLSSTNNHIAGGIISGSAASANIGGAASLDLGAITTTGAFTATSTGAVTESGILTTGGATSITAGADLGITMTQANHVNGVLTLSDAGGVVSFSNITALELGNVTAATFSSTDTSAVTQAAGTALNITGITNIGAESSNVTLANTGNDFGGAVTVDGGAIQLTQGGSNALTLASVSASGDVTILDNGGILTLTGTTPTIAERSAGNKVILSAATLVDSNTGSNSVIDLDGSGAWNIYLTNLDGNTFGSNMASGEQAIWGTTYGDSMTATGNRYIFSITPTLTVNPETTPFQVSKIGGATASLPTAVAETNYEIDPSTFVDAATYGGVFTQDTVNNVTINGVSFTSLGAPSNAPLGLYDVTMTGTGSSSTGYSIDYNSTAQFGQLTVKNNPPTNTTQSGSSSNVNPLNIGSTIFDVTAQNNATQNSPALKNCINNDADPQCEVIISTTEGQ